MAWDGYISGKNIELVKGKKIVQEWTTEWPAGYPPSRLEFTLTVKGGGTQLKMVHSRVPADRPMTTPRDGTMHTGTHSKSTSRGKMRASKKSASGRNR
jgi:uncharacterized protein YndB with AHSA1/START domain